MQKFRKIRNDKEKTESVRALKAIPGRKNDPVVLSSLRDCVSIQQIKKKISEGKGMNYREVLAYIHHTQKFGSKLGLENITALLDLMGNPHRDLKVIHVAGTNGKGSTCSFIASVLKEQGYKVGLYTSPYLEEFTERIRINGQNIPERKLAEIVHLQNQR